MNGRKEKQNWTVFAPDHRQSSLLSGLPTKTSVYEITKMCPDGNEVDDVSFCREGYSRRSGQKRIRYFEDILKEKTFGDLESSKATLANNIVITRPIFRSGVYGNLCYRSFGLRNLQLLAERNMEDRNLIYQALFNDIQCGSTGCF